MSSSKISKEQQLFHSLVKYDTPYLVSTTVNNKKALEELSQDTQKTNSILRSIFYRNKNTSNSNEETEDFSLKDALNKILPPKKNNNEWTIMGSICFLYTSNKNGSNNIKRRIR